MESPHLMAGFSLQDTLFMPFLPNLRAFTKTNRVWSLPGVEKTSSHLALTYEPPERKLKTLRAASVSWR